MDSTKYDIQENGCWEWNGFRNYKGYGHTARKVGGEWFSISAHRLSYEIAKGSVPEGLQIDHLCRNRACVNPDHLEAVTSRENTMRSPIGVTSRNARKTHCVNGHPFSEENTIIKKGDWKYQQRECRTCRRAIQTKYNRRIRAEAKAERLAKKKPSLETPNTESL